VEIPQQGDVVAQGKTDATTRCDDRALPDLQVTRDCGDRPKHSKQAQDPCSHFSSLEGLTAVTDGITLKGEFQVDMASFIAWFFGFMGRPTRREWWLVGYTGALTLLSSGLVSTLLAEGVGLRAPWPVGALAIAAFVADRQSVRLSPRAEVSVSALPIVLAAVLYGPLAAILVSVASLIPSFRQPLGRWLTWTVTRSLAGGCAGVVASALAGGDGRSFGRLLGAVAAATVVEQVGNVGLAWVPARLRGLSASEIARLASAVFLAMPLYAPVTALLVYSYREISPWSVVLFLFPAFVAQKLFLLYREQRATAEELAEAIARQERANLSFASALVATLDARDQYSAGHSAAVAVYARDIATRLGLSERQQELAHVCGLVHDIGKVGLLPGLLEKPGPLTPEERHRMEGHSVIGERILENVEDYAEIAAIVRHHHERVDGRGYPDGLGLEDIPLVSRIIAVADAYNAMTSKRPYRDAMPSGVARIRLARGVGTQFDTSVVAAFEAILANATEEYRSGRGPEFSREVQAPQDLVVDRPAPRILQAIAS
jgi:putative nucleotidyltransferase with HDIG domain